MTNLPNPKNSVFNAIKLYFFPSLVTILAMMIWRDVSELRSDVKQLLAESNSNKAKVENLQKQVDRLNQAVFKIPPISTGRHPQESDNQQVDKVYAILTKDEYAFSKKYIDYKNK